MMEVESPHHVDSLIGVEYSEGQRVGAEDPKTLISQHAAGHGTQGIQDSRYISLFNPIAAKWDAVEAFAAQMAFSSWQYTSSPPRGTAGHIDAAELTGRNRNPPPKGRICVLVLYKVLFFYKEGSGNIFEFFEILRLYLRPINIVTVEITGMIILSRVSLVFLNCNFLTSSVGMVSSFLMK
jgi:hypothetical protein